MYIGRPTERFGGPVALFVQVVICKPIFFLFKYMEIRLRGYSFFFLNNTYFLVNSYFIKLTLIS